MEEQTLINHIQHKLSELKQLIQTHYSKEIPSAIEQSLVRLKCTELYDLLLKQADQRIDDNPLIAVEQLAQEPIVTNHPPAPSLFNDIPEKEEVIQEKVEEIYTPTELKNQEIDELLEEKEKTLPSIELPKETINELSLHEKIANNMPANAALSDRLSNTIASLKSAINVNLKIAIVNQLFNENTVDYVKAIDKLNSSENIHEALRYFNELKHQNNWENENELVKELEQLIQKRFV